MAKSDKKLKIKTAEIVAFSRAYHYKYEGPNYILEDKYAIELTSFFWRVIVNTKIFTSIIKKYIYGDLLPITSQHIYRQRFVEDKILNLAKNSEEPIQYVILGAGLDAFAFRHKLKNVEIFELDLPLTQQEKIRRVKKRNYKIPQNLHFIPTDFNQNALKEVLFRNSNYDASKKTIFNWMGVSYYLPLEIIKNTLSDILKFSPQGSSVIFDFLLAEDSLKGKELIFYQKMKKITAKKGEKMITEFYIEDFQKITSELEGNYELFLAEDLTQLIGERLDIAPLPKCLAYCEIKKK